ncbi:hydrogenase nickel incorporation protein HypB [Kineosphaera limosa]|uniref:Hydrogenase nickel incorporation protein HypB n=1 Tax=Kineosphaera limosa NBRC 100340 TaxID=1184609 RepID=K6X197_9MICO|nr:hydrogenase nickel incorporation protein HypB [Kineosphaera limosa]NYE00198.1 hydrogenase nickel incorporation protein HypB [Kineosphaera limosa]GAB98147.1 hydrogenase nickel incorporation protein HypB [Kineosphaera limosa NBRC 100340]
MGRFHRHDDGTEHAHEHGDHDHSHDHSQGSDHLGDHSGYATGTERITVLERIFDENDAAAAANRRAFDEHGVRVVNLMSAPGAGKTTVLAATLAWCRDQGIRAGVVEGDIETSLDADRLAGFGAQVALLNTGDGFGGECHLDAPMVAKALGDLDLAGLDLLFVENVGNLVCPAEFDVGAHHRVMVYAITEGEEKPLKYPVMFRACEVVLLNKVDLVPYLDADPADFATNLAQVNPAATVLPVSSRDSDSYTGWFDWLAGSVLAR